MKRMCQMLVLTVVFMALAIGAFNIDNSSAAVKKPKYCWLLLYHDCFKDFNFKPDIKTWSQSIISMNIASLTYQRWDIRPESPDKKGGIWFRWQKSFFMHQLCAQVSNIGSCVVWDPGFPVYGGSLTGAETNAKGQGFMTKTKGKDTYAWPSCWYLQPATREFWTYCPNTSDRRDGELDATDENDEEDENDDEPDDPEAIQARFMELRDSWLNSIGSSE